MNIGERLFVTQRAAWRAWLGEHGATHKEIWLVFFKKSSGKQGLTYDEAVHEALCFGWIDGQMKGIDSETYALRFCPRRKRSRWSLTNRALARQLIADNKMTAAGLAALPADLDGDAGDEAGFTVVR